jgi:hypothetical protein
LADRRVRSQWRPRASAQILRSNDQAACSLSTCAAGFARGRHAAPQSTCTVSAGACSGATRHLSPLLPPWRGDMASLAAPDAAAGMKTRGVKRAAEQAASLPPTPLMTPVMAPAVTAPRGTVVANFVDKTEMVRRRHSLCGSSR